MTSEQIAQEIRGLKNDRDSLKLSMSSLERETRILEQVVAQQEALILEQADLAASEGEGDVKSVAPELTITGSQQITADKLSDGSYQLGNLDQTMHRFRPTENRSHTNKIWMTTGAWYAPGSTGAITQYTCTNLSGGADAEKQEIELELDWAIFNGVTRAYCVATANRSADTFTISVTTADTTSIDVRLLFVIDVDPRTETEIALPYRFYRRQLSDIWETSYPPTVEASVRIFALPQSTSAAPGFHDGHLQFDTVHIVTNTDVLDVSVGAVGAVPPEETGVIVKQGMTGIYKVSFTCRCDSITDGETGGLAEATIVVRVADNNGDPLGDEKLRWYHALQSPAFPSSINTGDNKLSNQHSVSALIWVDAAVADKIIHADYLLEVDTVDSSVAMSGASMSVHFIELASLTP